MGSLDKSTKRSSCSDLHLTRYSREAIKPGCSTNGAGDNSPWLLPLSKSTTRTRHRRPDQLADFSRRLLHEPCNVNTSSGDMLSSDMVGHRCGWAVESIAEDDHVIGRAVQRLKEDVETVKHIRIDIGNQRLVEIPTNARLPTVTFKAPASQFSGRALGLALAYCSDLREVSVYHHSNVDARS